jgi:predicted O-methyltransferase YrrM
MSTLPSKRLQRKRPSAPTSTEATSGVNTKSVKVLDKTFAISGDDDYLREMGEEFEPDNVHLLSLLCDNDSRVLDVGANIGMTALALSQICPRGQIVAIEPMPRTFQVPATQCM